MRPRLRLKILAAVSFLAAALLSFPGPSPAQSPPEEAPPAVVLDPGQSLNEDEAEETLPAGPAESEIDLSAPGMTGLSGGTTPISLVEAAYLAHRRGDFQEAIEGYTRIISRRGLTRKERAVSYLLRGEAKRDFGQLDEAVLDFTRALRQWPGYPTAHYFRGRVYERQGRLTEAHADLARAVQLDPAREAYATSLTILKLRLKEEGLIDDLAASAPEPTEPPLPGD